MLIKLMYWHAVLIHTPSHLHTYLNKNIYGPLLHTKFIDTLHAFTYQVMYIFI